MKTAVVFYSLDGNCTFIAGEIKNLLSTELIQLYTKDQKKRGKLGKFFWGGGMVFRRIKPPLKPYTFDPSVYDLIIIGTPVWAGTPAPPIRTFISEAGITGKKIALFVCQLGDNGNIFGKIKALLTGNEIVAETAFTGPVKSGSEEVRRQITDWLKGMGE